MRLVVTGGRYFDDAPTLHRVLGWLNPTEVGQGGAKGADMLAKHWADDNGVPTVTFPAEWDKYGKGAGPIRNKRMLDEFKPDITIAFPGNAGTENCIWYSEAAGIPTYRVTFVFGSNLAGRHGMGAAAHATAVWQARRGIGNGETGWSYAIPTKNEKIQTLPLDQIKHFVDCFLDHAKRTHDLFFVTAVGCGLAGYKPTDIAPMFEEAPGNCILPMGWTHRPCSPSLVEVCPQKAASGGSNPPRGTI